MIGQLNIFDYLEKETISKPPVLLNAGQEVFLVIKGDVERYIVLEETWICGEKEDERGYRLQRPNNGIYNATWNNSIGTSCFEDYQSAFEVAEAYLNKSDVIRAENIVAIKTTAYSYIRACDNKEMIAFYSELENGMLYVKEFMTYQHMVEATKKEKALKKFMEQRELRKNDVKEIEYHPAFKNMYKIKQTYDWDYAEASHSYAIG